MGFRNLLLCCRGNSGKNSYVYYGRCGTVSFKISLSLSGCLPIAILSANMFLEKLCHLRTMYRGSVNKKSYFCLQSHLDSSYASSLIYFVPATQTSFVSFPHQILLCFKALCNTCCSLCLEHTCSSSFSFFS